VASAFSTILIPTDGSESAAAATNLALALARRVGARVVFANVVDVRVMIDLEELAKDEARALLDFAQKRATDAGVASDAEILVGPLVPSIVDHARECGADLIAMGTRARHGIERFFGTVTSGVLRSATIPVLVVPEECTRSTFEHLLVGVDDSEPSDAAIGLAIDYAYQTKAELTFCAVVDTATIVDRAATYGFEPAPIVDDANARAERVLVAAIAKVRHEHVRVRHTLFHSPNAVDGLLEAAEQAGSDAIVVGTHGRRGLRHMFLGSVAEGLARGSDRPVLVAHAHVEKLINA
jgi:nucleotide-binding universal stress UspA family protein